MVKQASKIRKTRGTAQISAVLASAMVVGPGGYSIAVPAGSSTAKSPTRTTRSSPIVIAQVGGATAPDAANPLVTLNMAGADIQLVLRALAEQTGLNIVTATGVTGVISIKLDHVPVTQALDVITKLNNLAYERTGNTIIVGTPDQVRNAYQQMLGPIVITLAHASAADVAVALGKSFPKLQVTQNGPSQVVLMGYQADLDAAKQLITALDVPPPVAAVAPMAQDLVQLKNALATDVVNILKQAYPKITALAQGTRTIVLVGDQEDVTNAEGFANRLDQATPPPTVALAQDVITLQKAHAQDLIPVLQQYFPTLTLRARNDNQIVVTGPANDITAAVTFAPKLDVAAPVVLPPPQPLRTVAYRSRYANPRDLVNILQAQFGSSIQTVLGPGPVFVATAGGGTSISSTSVSPGLALAGGAGGAAAGASAPGATLPGATSPGMTPAGSNIPGTTTPGTTTPGTAPYGTPAAATGPTSLGPNSASSSGTGSQVDLLLLTGTQTSIDSALALLGQVDVPPQQVLIETKVVDVSLDLIQQVGVTWNFLGYGFGENTPATGAATAGGGIGIPGFPFSAGPVRSPINATVDLQNNDQRNKVLADPKIFALSDRPADIFIGDQITYVSNVDRTTNGTSITTATQDVGIDLSMYSHVEPDGHITLSVAPDVSFVTSFTPGANGAQLPQISKRRANTVMRLNDGETIAIGGLIRDSDLNNLQKVPLLGDLPFFGELFRHRRTEHIRSEVVIFIRASIVHQPA